MTTTTAVDVGKPEVEVRIGGRSAAVLAVASLAGLVLFIWPLLIPVPAGWTHTQDAPIVFAALVPIMVLLVLTQLSDGGMDTRTPALLGVLSASNGPPRPPTPACPAGTHTGLLPPPCAGGARASSPGATLVHAAGFCSSARNAGSDHGRGNAASSIDSTWARSGTVISRSTTSMLGVRKPKGPSCG